ncbi:MAG: S1 RNA-binding domain-containing protein [Patescibacteria group bacterium]|nr:S1 RNA-binding domain-containing protein [Patescibacteria group bacterium]
MADLQKKSSKNSEMEDLLNAKEAPAFPRVGENIKGKVIEMGSNIIYVDLGPIGTGAVYGYGRFSGLSIFKNMKSGSSISATVTDLENEDGYVEMSLKQTSAEMIWKELEKKMEEKEVITTTVLEANKGGLMVKISGVIGFLPASQLTGEHYPRVSDGDKNKILSLLAQIVGKDVKVRIIGIDKSEGKLIVSEKITKEKEELEKISDLKLGDTIEGEISGIVNFGAFVKFNNSLEGLVHISELAWKLIDDPRKLFNVGQKVKCKIIGIDDSRISLSIKALENDPWNNVGEKYQIGQKVIGEVTKINPFGAFVQLDKDIHGLVHISKIAENNVSQDLEIGNTYDFEIILIKPREHRLGLKPYSKSKPKKEEKTDKKEKTEEKPKTKPEAKPKTAKKKKDDEK